MPALYLVVVSALVALIAYRTYGAFLAAKVATLDDLRVRVTSPLAAEPSGA